MLPDLKSMVFAPSRFILGKTSPSWGNGTPLALISSLIRLVRRMWNQSNRREPISLQSTVKEKNISYYRKKSLWIKINHASSENPNHCYSISSYLNDYCYYSRVKGCNVFPRSLYFNAMKAHAMQKRGGRVLTVLFEMFRITVSSSFRLCYILKKLIKKKNCTYWLTVCCRFPWVVLFFEKSVMFSLFILFQRNIIVKHQAINFELRPFHICAIYNNNHCIWRHGSALA